MEKKELDILIERTHIVYPFESPNPVKEYSGFQFYLTTLEEKINYIIEKKTTQWDLLIQLIKNKQAYEVFDFGYIQFPSYTAHLLLNAHEENGARIEKRLIINISLLVNSFTLFIEESITPVGSFSQRAILKYETNSVQDKELLEKLKEEIKSFFEDYFYVSHKELFETQLAGGLLYFDGNDYPEEKISLYRYLYDASYVKLDFQVLL